MCQLARKIAARGHPENNRGASDGAPVDLIIQLSQPDQPPQVPTVVRNESLTHP